MPHSSKTTCTPNKPQRAAKNHHGQRIGAPKKRKESSSKNTVVYDFVGIAG